MAIEVFHRLELPIIIDFDDIESQYTNHGWVTLHGIDKFTGRVVFARNPDTHSQQHQKCFDQYNATRVTAVRPACQEHCNTATKRVMAVRPACQKHCDTVTNKVTVARPACQEHCDNTIKRVTLWNICHKHSSLMCVFYHAYLNANPGTASSSVSLVVTSLSLSLSPSSCSSWISSSSSLGMCGESILSWRGEFLWIRILRYQMVTFWLAGRKCDKHSKRTRRALC